MNKIEDLLSVFCGPDREEILKAVEAKEAGASEMENFARKIGEGTVEEMLSTIEAAVTGILLGMALKTRTETKQLRETYGLKKEGDSV